MGIDGGKFTSKIEICACKRHVKPSRSAEGLAATGGEGPAEYEGVAEGHTQPLGKDP